MNDVELCRVYYQLPVVPGVVFVGLPVVDHMDDGIGCFERACERKV